MSIIIGIRPLIPQISLGGSGGPMSHLTRGLWGSKVLSAVEEFSVLSLDVIANEVIPGIKVA